MFYASSFKVLAKFCFSVYTGSCYGSYKKPVHPGSKGGGNSGGQGGGVIDIDVARYLHLDGILMSLGNNATNDNSGGGSGGSIHIVAVNFSGHGLATTEGGYGHNLGHGGGGGRIAAHVSWFREYTGEYKTYGGHGGSGRTDDDKNGAAGTIYFTDSNSQGLNAKELVNTTEGLVYKDGFVKLYIDNDNRNHKAPTIIMTDDGIHDFEFDELEANNHAVLQIYGSSSELVVHKFSGDRTGLMHILEGQVIHVEYKESTTGYTVAPVSYKVEKGTEIVLPSTVIMLGTRSELHGLMTNVQNLTIAEGADVEFYSTSQTALRENGSYIHMTKPGNISLTIFTVQRGSVARFTETEANLVLQLIKFHIMFQGRVYMTDGTIFSAEGVVESEGFLYLDYMGYGSETGPGNGTTEGSLGYGAAHGGHGGAPKPNTGGIPYDSVYVPKHEGSGGGNGKGRGGRGGGYLVWRVGTHLWIDGEVTMQGENGQGLNAGGGSGGAIVIETLNFTGYGHVDCSGGNGSSTGKGGGGSGGRIGILIHFDRRFAGLLNAYGGHGSGGMESGAAGTVYIEETNRGPDYEDIKYDKVLNETNRVGNHRRILIDNNHTDKHLYVNHGEPWLYSSVNEGATTNYAFDEMDLRGHANVIFDYPPSGEGVEVIVHEMQGDLTGLIHVRQKQILYVEVVESVSNETYAPVSFKIDAKSEVQFPEIVNLVGRRNWFAGLITGIEELLIRGGADVLFFSTGHTALLTNGTRYRMTTEGNFEWAILKVMRNSRANFRQIANPLSITVAKFYVKYEGLLLMNLALIRSSYGSVEAEGEFNLDAVGNPAESGRGAGWTVSGKGCGAGHGGWGGGPSPDFGGVPYNSVFKPGNGTAYPTMEYTGSGGGNGGGTGGTGGGFLVWEIGDLLELNGILTLNGGDGQSSHAGGGSGGSLLITALNMSGHGDIYVAGGNGVGDGYGGSGGRVGVHCEWRYSFGGTYHNYGGNGGGTFESAKVGASGTTFIQENTRPLAYRKKKYNSVYNMTYFDVDHKYLHTDNRGKYSPAETLIMENYKYNYVFNETELTGSTRLKIYHPSNATRVDVDILRFIGDKTGVLIIQNDQHVVVEITEAIFNKTEAPCGFDLRAGGEIYLPAETHLHGADSTFAGLITGVANLFVEDATDIEFHSTAYTALVENGTYYNVKEEGNFAWDTFTVKNGGTIGFLKITKAMHIWNSETRVKYGANLYMNDAIIDSSYAWIESQGILHLNGHGHKPEEGLGAGRTISSQGYGASHGGYGGGSNPSLPTEPYNSVYDPAIFGSGGGNGSGVGGNGGGLLLWNISQRMELNGLLALQGNNGQSGNSGGGSGGSINMFTTNFTGHGEINVRGGNGSGSTGGGGSGGRIGVHCRYRYSYGGKFTNHGGDGGSAAELTHGGAAGTTFVENNFRPLEYRILKYMKGTNNTYLQVDHRYLHIDNDGNLVSVPTVIMVNETTDYEFDEVEIAGFARVIIYHPNKPVQIIIHRFIGDRTGQLHLRSHQKAIVEYVESIRNVTEAPVSYIIDYGSEIVFPTEVHMQGINTIIDGLMTGVHHFYIEDGTVVSVSSTSQTALLDNGTYVFVSEEGDFALPTINIKKLGTLEFRKILTDFTITASFMEVKYQGTVLMNHGYMDLGAFDIEPEGELNLDGRGHGPSTGPGVGSGYAGGSYGGVGGGSDDSHPYGSVFSPMDLGSGGAGSNSGSGGGFLKMMVGRNIHIDGEISSGGSSATSSSAGGGSGGSIFITAYNISGHGTINVNGGKGFGSGGGGSGGRIALHVGFFNLYGGRYLSHGGTGSSVGGPGTIYKYESQRGPQYRELKYNPRLNRTMIEPEHSKLLVDNGALNTINPAMVMENNSIYYEFNEVQVEGYSYIHFYHPHGVDNVTVLIHELTGNKKGMVRVQSRQQVIVHFVESTHTYLDAPCGLHVDVGGELVLPTEFILTTEKFILSGRLVGVENICIERNAELILSEHAHTGELRSLVMWYTDKSVHPYTPGVVTIGTITVNNKGLITVTMDPLFPTITGGKFTVKNGGTVETDSLKVKLNSTRMTVEYGGTVQGDGHGYPKGQGQGTGSDSTDWASGAGHGSAGMF